MIRVQIPSMPTAAELRPYLERMDTNKVYVNRGPLVQELEACLGAICGVPVVTVSSGTAALELAMSFWSGSYFADIPALTFSATGLAARASGHDVALCDVGEDLHLHKGWCSGGNRSIAVPVATFGNPVNSAEWTGRLGPVVIDAAGAILAQECSLDKNIATCFSLHATKFIGCGEGGFVASFNADLIEAVRSMSTFGPGGTNAKMSEYHAAVALASIDRMSDKMAQTKELNDWYDECANEIEFYDNGNMYNTLKVVILPVGVSAAKVGNQMRSAGIETRMWYRPWLDEREEFYDQSQRLILPVTDRFRDRLLGVPFHLQMSRGDVRLVMLKLMEAING